MSQPDAASKQLQDLERNLTAEVKTVNIRLREGEYQFSLAKAIATFELDLTFPNVKDLVKKLYGEKKTGDPAFVAKIQTILKKMEKSGILQILPKEQPWELQKYTLNSFKFQDVEKNLIILVSESEIKKTRELIHSQPPTRTNTHTSPVDRTVRISFLVSIVIISFAVILWTLAQPTINLLIFISTFCVAAVSSTVLGISIVRKK